MSITREELKVGESYQSDAFIRIVTAIGENNLLSKVEGGREFDNSIEYFLANFSVVLKEREKIEYVTIDVKGLLCEVTRERHYGNHKTKEILSTRWV